MPDTFSNVINPNVPGLDASLATGQRVTTRTSAFLFNASQGAIIAALVDPFGSGSTFSTVGTVPAQLALSGSNIVKGSAAGVPGAEYKIRVLASSADGLRDTSAILSFTAKSELPPVVTPTPTPTPTPTLTLSQTSPSIASNAASGTLVSNISNVPAGATPTVTPNDGRLVIAGDSSAGWKVVVGMSALSAGTVNFSVAATGATGASGVLTVTAATTGDEALISPLPSSARSSYAFTDMGAFQSAYPEMGPSDSSSVPLGPYYNDVIDVRAHPFYAPLGIMGALYNSTDHDADRGGIYSSFTKDPTLKTGWTPYTTSVANGWFAGATLTYTANPVLRGVSAEQWETPCVNLLADGTFVMTFQYARGGTLSAASGGIGQSRQNTGRAISPDGINWTVNATPVLVQTVDQGPAIGHAGYFRWGPNPFTGLVNPATGQPYLYIGEGLGSAGDLSTGAQWGTDNPKTGTWDFIQALIRQAGAVSEEVVGQTSVMALQTTMDVKSVRAVRQGMSAVLNAKVFGSSGTAVSASKIYEALIDPTGTEVIAKPIQLIPDDTRLGLNTPGIVTTDAERIMFYQQEITPSTGVSRNAIGVAASPRRNYGNTFFDPLTTLQVPTTGLTTRDVDFKTVSALPSWLTPVAVNGQALTFDSTDGLGVDVPVSTTPGEIYLFGEQIPASANFVDIIIEDWKNLTGDVTRRWAIGFRTAATATSSPQNAVYIANFGTGTGNELLYNKQLVAGTAQTTTQSNALTCNAASARHVGCGFTNIRPRNRKNVIGLRWHRAENRLYLLAENKKVRGLPIERFALCPAATGPSGSVFTQAFFPFVAIMGNVSTPGLVQERIGKLRIRWA